MSPISVLKRPLLDVIIKRAHDSLAKMEESTNAEEDLRLSAKKELKSYMIKYTRCANLLLANEQDERIRKIVNKQDCFGNTPLHYANETWPQNVIKNLLKFGADVCIENDEKRIPLRRIPTETISEFLDEYCMKTDDLNVLDDEQEDDPDDYKKLLDEYEPRFMTNIGKAPVTFDYGILSPVAYTGKDAKKKDKNMPQSEISVLHQISQSDEHKWLVTHPVIKSFIWIKWNLVARYYSRKLRMDLLLTYFLTWYVFNHFGGFEWNVTCEVPSHFNISSENFCQDYRERYKNLTDWKKYAELEQMTIMQKTTKYLKEFGTFSKCMYLDTAYILFVPLAIGVVYWMANDIRRLFLSPNPYAHGGMPAPKKITCMSFILPLGMDIINLGVIIIMLTLSESMLWFSISIIFLVWTYFESRQFMVSPTTHFNRLSNWADALFIFLVVVVVYFPNELIKDPLDYALSVAVFNVCPEPKSCDNTTLTKIEYQECLEPLANKFYDDHDVTVKRGLSAFLIVLSWTRFLFQVAKNPSRTTERFNKYAMMYRRVATSFLKILFIYSFFILSFAMGFYILFHNDIGSKKLDVKGLTSYVGFETPYEAVVKTTAMFVGEVDFNNIPIGISYARRDGNISVTLAYAFYTMFMFMVTIVLMNLMNGLAVTDITEIIHEADTLHQSSMIEILKDFEIKAMKNRQGLNRMSKICPCLRSVLIKMFDISGEFLLFHLPDSSSDKDENEDQNTTASQRTTRIRTLPNLEDEAQNPGCLRRFMARNFHARGKQGCEPVVVEARKKLLSFQKLKMEQRANEKRQNADAKQERQKTVALIKEVLQDN